MSTWIESWLGLEEAAIGEGTDWHFDYSWPWPSWIALLFVMLTFSFVFGIYFREGSASIFRKALLAFVRLCAIAIVLFMIMQVRISVERTGLPFLVIAIDGSASMATVDHYEDQKLQDFILKQMQEHGYVTEDRLSQAKAILFNQKTNWIEKLEKDYKVRLYFLATEAVEQIGNTAELQEKITALTAEGKQTRLGYGLKRIVKDLRGTPPTAIILFTDGINTSGETLSEIAASELQSKTIPLYIVGLGSDAVQKDIAVSDLLVEDMVFVDDLVQFEFRVTSTGYSGQTVKVQLFEKGKSQPISESDVTLPEDGETKTVRISHRPKEVGDFEYRLKIQPDQSEVNPNNNQLTKTIQVREGEIRVLYVQASPSFEYRYLKSLLEREKTVKLTVVLQEADPKYADFDRSAIPVFPVSKEELFENYDVLIFGDVNPNFLGTQVANHVVDFVTEKAGSVIFIAGNRYLPASYRGNPLAKLFPFNVEDATVPDPEQVSSEPFKLNLTEFGAVSPQMQLGQNWKSTQEIWRKGLAPMFWFTRIEKLKPGVRVLAEHSKETSAENKTPLPIFTMQYSGQGIILFHATDDTWRWRYQIGDTYFARYWVQAIRFLSRAKLLGGEQSIELTVDRGIDQPVYYRGETVQLRVRFLDERMAPQDDSGVAVMVEDATQRYKVTLNRSSAKRALFEGTFKQTKEGNYHWWLVDPSVEGTPPSGDFTVKPPQGETERIRIDRDEMTRAVERTHGKQYNFSNAQQVLKDLPDGRRVPIESLPPIPLWNRWPVIALFALLLIVEWVVRKQSGMV